MHFKFPSLDILCEREDRSSETLKKNTVTTSIASVQSVSYSNVTRFCARKCMMLHLVGQLGLEVLKRHLDSRYHNSADLVFYSKYLALDMN